MKIQRNRYAVLCAVFLLLACTMLSQKIEVEMRTQVVVKKTAAFKLSADVTLPVYASFDGNIYELTAGTGWTTGQTTAAVYTGKCHFDESSDTWELPGSAGRTLVVSASRTPQSGEAVQVIEQTFTESAEYLIVCPEGIPELAETLPGKVLRKSGTALLLRMPNAKLPFLENSVKGGLSALQTPEWRVFSMADIEQFRASLPFVYLLIPVILVPVVVCLCFLLFSTLRTRRGLWVFLLLCAGALFFLRLLLRHIDLPSSMLPAENIFDIRFYSAMLRMINSALQAL